MTPTGSGPKYLRTLCWESTYQFPTLFLPYAEFDFLNLLELLQTYDCREMSRSWWFESFHGLSRSCGGISAGLSNLLPHKYSNKLFSFLVLALIVVDLDHISVARGS